MRLTASNNAGSLVAVVRSWLRARTSSPTRSTMVSSSCTSTRIVASKVLLERVLPERDRISGLATGANLSASAG